MLQKTPVCNFQQALTKQRIYQLWRHSMMEKHLERANLTIEKTDTYRIRKTYHEISSYLNNKLQLLGDGKPPAGLELPDVETGHVAGDVGDYHRNSVTQTVCLIYFFFKSFHNLKLVEKIYFIKFLKTAIEVVFIWINV